MTRNENRRGWAAAAAGILIASAMTAGAASASTIYTFHQTGSTPGGLPFAIEMHFDGAPGPIAGNVFDGGFAGLVHFSFRTTGIYVGLQDLLGMQAQCDANPSYFHCSLSALSYDLSPERGSIRYNNNNYDFSFSYGDSALRGAFNTDFTGPAACRLTGVCTYEGAWYPIPGAIAEPATLGLLSAGLLGLAWRGRRMKGRPALAS